MLNSLDDETATRYTLAFAVRLWEAVDTPRSLGLALRLQYDGISAVVRESVNPRDYCDPASFFKDYSCVKYLAKIRGLVPDQLLEEEALRRFKVAEAKCASTNVRLFHGRPIGLEHILSCARRKIVRWIGFTPDIDSIVSRSQWGPGATATLKGDSVRPDYKMLEPKLSVTSRLKRFAMSVVGRDLHWTQARLGPSVEVVGPCTLLPREFNPVDWMRVITVEKDCKTRRTIGAEPTFNTWFQSGIGRELRALLERSGIYLDDQRINQSWAELACSLGLATVDLEAASDSIAYWLVESVIPPAWFQLLDAARSPYARIHGKVCELEKFSSMGNGFTFELETLIFRALVEAVCEEVGEPTVTVSVYGDDIIVPAPAYNRLVEVFRIVGFTVNSEKSYHDGLFYESCGEHYFDSVRVTPLYQKELFHGLPELVRSHNRVHRWLDRAPDGVGINPGVTSVIRDWCERLSDRVPRIPYGMLGDKGLWTKSLELPYIDGRVLCDVVEQEGLVAPSLNDAALYAISLQRKAPRRDYEWHDYMQDVTIAWYDTVEQSCVVPLRGSGPSRVSRRWLEVTTQVISLSNTFLTKETVVTNSNGTYQLLPQLRSTALLS